MDLVALLTQIVAHRCMGLIVLHVHRAMSHIAVKRSLLAIRLQVSGPVALQRMPRARRNCLDAAAGHMGRVPYWGTLCRCSAEPQATPDLAEMPRQVVCEPRLSHNMRKVLGGLDRCHFQSILYVHVDRSGYGAGHSRFFVGVHTAAENKMARRAC